MKIKGLSNEFLMTFRASLTCYFIYAVKDPSNLISISNAYIALIM